MGLHQRTPGEYVRPPRRLDLLPYSAFIDAQRCGPVEFDDVDAFLTGVRATDYFRTAFSGVAYGPVWFELVPEPDNRWDACAVAVDLSGQRCGYIAASIAAHLHWRVRQLNLRGQACFVPGRYEHDEVWTVLPTFQALESQVDVEGALAELEALYADLPAEVRACVETNMFHIADTNTWAHWCARRHIAPAAGIPRQPDLDQVPPLVNRFLMNLRHAAKEERAKERDARMQAKADARARRQADQVRAKAERDDRVAEALLMGGSVAGTARVVGVSEETVRRIRNERGLPAAEVQGQESRVRRAQLALDLANLGVSRAAVGRELGVGVDMVKDLLSLARFLLDPHRLPDRLELAARAARDGWSNGQARTAGERRAVTDARALAIANPAALQTPAAGHEDGASETSPT